MSTAETTTGSAAETAQTATRTARQPRRTPGLVPVAETLSTAERRTPEPAPPGLPPPVRRPGAFWRLLGSELGLTFRRPRNLAMLAVVGAVPILVGVALRMVGGGDDDGMGGMIASVAGNSLMLTFVSFSFLTLLLMPVAVAVVGGDSIAGEAGAGTLRYLLAAPAGRTRLLAVKFLNVVVYGYAVTAVVALSALVTGLLLFPAGDVTLLSGTTVPLTDGLLRIALSVGYIGAGMAALGAVAVALSTFTEVPVGAIAGTVVAVVVCQVLRAIPDLAPLEPYLLPARFTSFDSVLRDPIDTGTLLDGLSVFGAYTVLSLSVAWARFTGKDITS
ncbi:ABC transporter permease [Nonomuraea sp. SBT364]|uniref:ABC transporter permease n=1 Tax=Nonomuraea sp. SBT364 TaxID=1580530 RepID=UPI00066EA16C|nr:ABC transporter permease [Nonomuraea sp. SBT364]